jgi:hypothetical protein
MSGSRQLPLAIAAQELRVSGEVARRLLLKGVLEGELRDGRWYVSSESVEAAKSSPHAVPERGVKG